MLRNRNDLHIGILKHNVQDRIVRGETARLARELRTPRWQAPRAEARRQGVKSAT
jgi:hypothetical protein